MIALVASVMLGLYIFVPDFLFNKFARPYSDLKKFERSKIEEITAGVLVAAIPFVAAYFLSSRLWFFGHWPFPVSESATAKIADYKLVFAGLYREEFFVTHQDEIWRAVAHLRWHQLRFLFWNYVLLATEIRLVRDLTLNYWRWKNNWFYRHFIASWLLRQISEWEALLRPFTFDPAERRSVIVDVLTSDGHLYTGTVADYFKERGSLTGVLLKNVRRFQYQRLQGDRKRQQQKETEQYWKVIPGANFYIAADKIVTMNIRFALPPSKLAAMLQKVLGQQFVIRSGPGGARD
jgi:hypothetical protein